MKPLITQTLKISLTNNTCPQMDIDYNSLKNTTLKDMRKQALVIEEDVERLKNLTENSVIPIPVFTDYMDDTSSESYHPHSDWQGPSGSSWIGK